MSAHAFLPPSSAGRWRYCALSASLEAAYPEIEKSPESMEGEAAHWVVQMLFQGTPAAIGMQAPNGVAVTLEMIDGAELAREEIVRVLGPDFAQFLVVERRVNMPRVHPTHNWGTPDYRAWVRLPDGRLCLYLWDYKFGHGIVEVYENWQFAEYAEGCLYEAGIDLSQESEVSIVLCVIQPRAPHKQGPVRSWETKASVIRRMIGELAVAAAEALGPNPSATPTPDGCRNCKGRHACEALQREAFEGVAMAYQLGAYDLSPHALGLELRTLERALELMKARASGLATQAEMTIKQGQHVPGWALDSVPGRLAWNKPKGEVFALGDMLGLDLRKESDPITPTQAKDAAKRKGISPELFNAFSERNAGAVKLIYDDGSKMRLIFSNT